MTTPPLTPSPHSLPRTLGGWSVFAIVVGITIGSGIFRTPATIASRAPDPAWMLSIWVAGGLISLCGALAVAELAATLPRTGGWYLYLRESWGPLAGFLFGWSELVLIRASATGAVATVCSSYLLRTLGIDASEQRIAILAAVAIVIACATNIRGARIGAAVTAVSTVAKLTALLALIAAALLIGHAAGGSATHFASGSSPLNGNALGLALISVLWAYDGFADVSFAAGEVRDPQRTLPRAIIGGTLTVIAVYTAVNIAYLYMRPIEAIASSPLIAADTARLLFGDAGVTLISAVVAVSTFGSLIGISLAAPRVFFAMAEDRLLFSTLARVHPRYQTPHVAIALSGALGVFFVLTRTFEQLADTFVLTIWPFYGLAVAGLFRLRRVRSAVPGVYRTPGYPVVPAIFIAAVVYLVVTAIAGDPVWTAVTFAIVLAGIPIYLFIRPRSRKG